jgi:hypothetical protein
LFAAFAMPSAGPVRLRQASPTKLISQNSFAIVDRFFAANMPDRPPTLTRRAFATFIEASRAYRRRDYAHCQAVLDEMWAASPIGAPEWSTQGDLPRTFVNLGGPASYPQLTMLDEAVRWRNDRASKGVKANPVRLEVVLLGKSEGILPRTKEELEKGTGIKVRHELDPMLLKNDYARVRNCLWLFQEYVLAISKGRLRVDLHFTYLPNHTIPMVAALEKGLYGPVAFATPDYAKLAELETSLTKTLKTPPDWWWIITPSHVPDAYPDFKRSEFITGGMGVGPDGDSPKFMIDDKWLVRRPPHMGQGVYDPIEVEAYVPGWFLHEFYHHLFRSYPEFELEKSSHQWHDRKQWPADFQGMYEPDFYREALYKRIQPKGLPLHLRLRYTPPPAKLLAKLTVRNLLGTYRLKAPQNPWHTGQITSDGVDGRGNPILRWTNQAGVSWKLYPRLSEGVLLTGDDNPYAKEPAEFSRRFKLLLKRDDQGRYLGEIQGFGFQGERFEKVGAAAQGD